MKSKYLWVYRLFLSGGRLGIKNGHKCMINKYAIHHILMCDVNDVSDEILLKYGVFKDG